MSPAEPPEWLARLAAALPGVRREDFARDLPRTGAERPSAVLLLLGEGPDGPDLLLIERSSTLRAHAGQPAFPGGSLDPGDGGPVGAALREATEEVGLDPAGVRVLGELPELYIAVTGYAVTPVVAWWERPVAVGPVDTVEVARVERVPLAELADPANRCRVRHPSGYIGPAFDVRGMLVWGFTAIVIDHVLKVGGWERPWSPGELRAVV